MIKCSLFIFKWNREYYEYICVKLRFKEVIKYKMTKYSSFNKTKQSICIILLVGLACSALKPNNIISGSNNYLDGNYNQLNGNFNQVRGNENLLKGNFNLLDGDRSILVGNFN